MEQKIFRMNNEQQVEGKETRVPKGQGVIFIKTRMSDNKIHDLVSEMKAVAEETNVDVVDVIVDEFASHDIDRDDISRLSEWMENSRVGIIFVKSITDITDDDEDLEKFIERAMYFDMIIVDFTNHVIIAPYVPEGDVE
ncbi:hypothetical protein SAMN02746066_01376 [Anaerosporobacter mobilis DSM 15930]|jgi:hypothetical protein|uniref:Resolvase, N terminal domain n=1 Tax=Anaerosporobacter mobilis DSM 15930 TaxID=1120996 RepID=A0A1M7HHI5_9FIRM|nr:hypothetical protein [Anaerosporobacter mobilis]SHM27965.1 hypothetical protein SAMN02746066_01376 [Anaerosporobacter mobilis DSM 15930]